MKESRPKECLSTASGLLVHAKDGMVQSWCMYLCSEKNRRMDGLVD
jgi:hypothetical protein